MVDLETEARDIRAKESNVKKAAPEKEDDDSEDKVKQSEIGG